jgi:hypothetical protein
MWWSVWTYKNVSLKLSLVSKYVILSMSLVPWNFLYKLVVPQLVNKFPASYGAWRFFTVLARWRSPVTCHLLAYGGIAPTLSLTSALEGRKWLAVRPGRIYPWAGTRCPLYRRLGGPHSRLDAEVRGKILCLRRWSNLGRSVRRQTLHWLNYPAHTVLARVLIYTTTLYYYYYYYYY